MDLTPPPLLARKRRLAQAALWVEQLWPAIWPGLGILGLYAGIALLDLPALLPSWPRLLLFALFLALAGVLLWRGLRRIARPSPALADRRLERDTGLAHRPLATLADRPAAPTPEQEALWRVHLARLAATIPRLVVRRPRPGLAARDTWALRGALVVFLVAAVAVAGPDSGARLLRAVTPTFPPIPAGPGTQIQAWITPPAYTGLPPILLRPETLELRVPTGSHLTASVTGDTAEPSLSVSGVTEPFRALDPASWQADRDITQTTSDAREHIEIRRGGLLAAWTVTLIPDLPPAPLFTEPPTQNTAGGTRTLQTRFAWQATDDYGVTQLQVEMHLTGRPDAPAFIVPVPLSGAPKSAHGIMTPDLTAHPWAGLPVIARLSAKDAANQLGKSDAADFTLPARDFQNPVAVALIAVRRQLSLMPEERRAARAVLDAIADDPASVDNSTAIILNLRTLSALLNRGRGQPAVDEAQARIWILALALEEDAPERTAQALEQAREALRDAVDAEKPPPEKPTTAEQAEIDRRMQELRDAIQKRMDALAEQARRDDTTMPFDPKLPQMNARDLDKMAQQLQQSLKDGRMDDAKQEMAELEKLLDALKNARPETGEEREKQRAERRQKGKDQMDAVQDMVQREGQLLDRTEKRSAEQPAPRPSDPRTLDQRQFDPQPRAGQPQPQRSQQQPAQQQPTQPQPAQQRAGDQKSQTAMRRALGELMQQFGDLTGDIPGPLGEADQAMRDAGEALADGRDAAAGAATKRAIEALQKGGRQMGQQVARQFGTGQQPGKGEGEEGQDGQGQGADGTQNGTQNGNGRTAGPRPGENPGSGQRRSANRDPLGRPLHQGTSGSAEAGDVHVPDEMEQARTREIQDELRRRGADRTRKQPELDYIDRLLKPF